LVEVFKGKNTQTEGFTNEQNVNKMTPKVMTVPDDTFGDDAAR
jgi:hypothetical protein